MSEVANELHERLMLDGTKIGLHADRLLAWSRGERVMPITIDMALNQRCQYKCGFCYMQLQKQSHNERITVDVALRLIEDFAEVGVRGVSLVSDGESTLSAAYMPIIRRGHELGISMASGTNALALTKERLLEVLPCLTYLRVNFSAGEPQRYAEIMGCKPGDYHRVVQNIRDMVALKREMSLDTTIGMQMVLRPDDADQILPFARLGAELGVDYAVIKHCSDDELGTLGVDYSGYERLYGLLHEAESLSTEACQVTVKWTKIEAKGRRSYQRCYGPPFLLQISGSGLVAPCGMLFNERYKEKFHIGNIATERFRDIVRSERYWEVMKRLSSDEFDAQTMCGTLCLQHKTNEYLDKYQKGERPLLQLTPLQRHENFV